MGFIAVLARSQEKGGGGGFNGEIYLNQSWGLNGRLQKREKFLLGLCQAACY